MSGVDGPQDVSASPEANASQKKSPLDNLSRDDLLKKCKSLLTIAQKAKQAKDDALEEVEKTKRQLNVTIKDSEKFKVDNEKLALRIRTLVEEKESFLSAIENVKSNNSELQNIIRSINAERDSFFIDIENLTVEKQKLIQVVDMMGGENDAMLAEIRDLKDNKRKLNEELFTAMSERETIESEIKDVKLQLVYLLNNSFELSKSLNVEINPDASSSVETNKKHTGVICDLIGKSNNNLRILIDSVSKSPSLDITNSSVTSVPEDNASGIDDSHQYLQHIDDLQKEVSTLESQVEILKNENSTMKGIIDDLKNTAINDAKRENELMNELERNRLTISEKKNEIQRLKDEISLLMKKNKEQAFNAKEMEGTKNLVKQLETTLGEKKAEIEAMKIVSNTFEVDNNKLSHQIELLEKELAEHKIQLSTVNDEKNGMEKIISDQLSSIESLEKTNNQIKDDYNKALLDLEQLKIEIANTRDLLEEKQLLLETAEKSAADQSSKNGTLIEKHVVEISNLQQLLSEKETEFQAALSQKQCDLDSIMSERNGLRTQVTMLEEKVASLSGDFVSPFEAMAESLTKTLLAKEQELATLQNQIRDMTQQLSTYCLDIDKERDERTKIEHLLKLKEQELTTLKEKSTSDAKCAKFDIGHLQKEIVRLQKISLADHKSSHDQSSVLEAERKSLREEIQLLKDGRDSAVQVLQKELNVLKAETLRFEETLKLRESELKSSQDFSKEMKAKTKNLRVELKQLKANRDDAIQDLQQNLDVLKADASRLQEALDCRDAELKESQVNNKQLEEELEKLRYDSGCKLELLQQEIKSAEVKISQLEGTVQDRDAELKSYQDSSEETKMLTSNWEEELKRLKSDHDSEIEILQKELHSVKKELEESKIKHSSTEENFEIVKSQLDCNVTELTTQVKELLEKLEMQEASSCDVQAKHEAEVQRLQIENSGKMETLQKELDCLKEETESLRETLTLYEEELQAARSMKEKNDNEKKQLQDEVLTEYKSLVDKLESDLKEIRALNDSLNIELTEKVSQFNQLQAEKDLLDQEHKTKMSELEQLKSDMQACIVDSNARISENEELKTEKEKLNNEIQAKTVECDELKSEKEKLNSDLKSWISENEELKSEKEKLTIDNATKASAIEQLLSEKATIDESRSLEIKNITSERDKLIVEYNSSITEVGQLKSKIEKLNLNIQTKIMEIEQLRFEKVSLDESKLSGIEDLSTENNKLLAEYNTKIKEIETLKSVNETLIVDNNTKTSEMNKILSEFESLKSENENLSIAIKTKISEMENILSKSTDLDQRRLSEIAELTSERDRLISEFRLKMTEVERDMTEQLRAADERYATKQEGLADELVNLRNGSAETEAGLTAVRAELQAAESKCQHLLEDMNELNQALKQRGETISKLKDLVKETERRLQEKDTDLAAVKEEAAKQREEVIAMKVEVTKHSEEVTALKEANRQAGEEAARLRSRLAQAERETRDQEPGDGGSCSTLSRADEAGRLHDVEDSFEERYTKLRAIAVRLKRRNAELVAQLEAVAGGARNQAALQAQHDKLQDLQDATFSELKVTKKRLEEAESSCAAVKRSLVEVTADNEKLHADLDAANKRKQTLENLRQELSSCTTTLLDREAQLATARAQAAQDGDRLRQAERSLQAQEEVAAGLRERTLAAEAAAEQEGRRAQEAAEQLQVIRTRLSEATAELSAQESRLASLTAEAEASRAASEQCSLEAAQAAAQAAQEQETARANTQRLQLKIRQLEDELKSAQECSSRASLELSRVVSDFEGYKVRARHVLKQKSHQTRAAGDEETAGGGGEEVAQLRAALDACHAKMEDARRRLEASESDVVTLSSDRDRALAKCRQLSERLSEVTSTNHQLSVATEAMRADHKDTLARQKVHADILATSYKTQLQEIEDRLSGDNAILRDQLDKLESKLREKSSKQPSSRASDAWTNSGAAFRPVRVEPGQAAPLLEREEGEGSESVGSSSPTLVQSRDRHELVSLEKLLASPTPDTEKSIARASPDAGKLRASEQQVRHLSALLADAEQDLARLAQLNEVLKEEIRRNQRSDEREKHAHNQEYLKNVVLKFVTLQGGDERSRLVPVLNTILKLSPEEASHLAGVAKGGETVGGNRGWSSYLFK